jgi:phosphonate transport system permease protein
MTKRSMLETDGLRARYPQAFNRPASSRLTWPLMLFVALAVFVLGLIHLGFSPIRMLNGLHQLGWISLMMLPPNPGTSLPLYLNALGETLSIALLGTTLAAAFAFPVSLLAAKNIVPSNIFRFPIRRFLDTIRGVDTLIWALVWINVVGLGPFAGVLVGAGGIGLQLAEQIRVLEWQRVSFLILMILIAVAVIDWISSKLRFAIIGPRAVA